MNDFTNSQMLGEVQPGDDLSTIVKKPTIKLIGVGVASAALVLFFMMRKRR